MDKKLQWANEVLNSLNGIKKAEPGEDLFAKIKAKLPVEKEVKVIPLHHLQWLAIASCVVIALNIYVFTSELKANKNEPVSNELLSNYSFYN